MLLGVCLKYDEGAAVRSHPIVSGGLVSLECLVTGKMTYMCAYVIMPRLLAGCGLLGALNGVLDGDGGDGILVLKMSCCRVDNLPNV